MIVRGSTPTHTFPLVYNRNDEISPLDTSLVKYISITYSQNNTIMFKKKTSEFNIIDGIPTAEIKLTQEDTLSLNCKYLVEIQARAFTFGGDVIPSPIYSVSVGKSLDDEVLS